MNTCVVLMQRIYQRLRYCNRSIFTENSLGLEDFRQFRTAKRSQIRMAPEAYWKRINHYFLPHNNLLIYTEDFKNAIALSETREHLEIIERMCRRYHQQSTRLKLFVYRFGPVVMRLFHEQKCTQLALKMIKDETMGDFFDFINCYAVCMDMLFKHEQYSDVIDVWNGYKRTKSYTVDSFPRSLQILIFGAFYKLGTRVAYDESLLILSDMVDMKVPIVRRALYFVAALCLKQQEAAMAMELLTLQKLPEDYATSRSLLCMSLSRLGRLGEAIDLLEVISVGDVGRGPTLNRKISAEVIEEIEKAAKSEDESRAFNSVLHSLKLANSILPYSIDQLLSTPVYQRNSAVKNEENEESVDTIQQFIEENVLRLRNAQTDLATVSASEELKEEIKRRVTTAVSERIASEGPYEA